MNSFDIPPSIYDYIRDQKISRSVEILLECLSNVEAPEILYRDEALVYNQAMLMAAQIRADYVEMLWRIWEETFGIAIKKATNLREEFSPECASPSFAWDERGVFSYLVHKGEGEVEEIKYQLSVEEYKKLSGIVLSAAIYNCKEGDYKNFDGEIPGWECVNDVNDRYSYFETDRINYDEFLADPKKHVIKWQEDAKKMVEFISKIV